MKTRNFKIFIPLLVALTSCVDVIENDEANNLMENKMTQVTIKTSVGDIQLELNDEKAPITVENFKTIASSGYYEGTIFHRVINGFMIQGGGLTADMNNSLVEPVLYKMKLIMDCQMTEVLLQWLERWIHTQLQVSSLLITRTMHF